MLTVNDDVVSLTLNMNIFKIVDFSVLPPFLNVSLFLCCQALLETALTRVVLPMPILILPPIIMAALEK